MPPIARRTTRRILTPRAYEEMVSAYFRKQGYTTEVTPSCNDYGVDVFALKGEQKLAIQAKMYGGTARKVNREMIMQLHGAKDYFDCTEAVIVTDGMVAENAREVAAKLQVRLMSLLQEETSAPEKPALSEEVRAIDSPPSALTFDAIWDRYVIPLAGRTLVGPDGRTNKLLTVDWSGVKRLTSSEGKQFIGIEVFRQAVTHILERGCVSRDEINQEYARRASSGVILILSQVPLFEHLTRPSRLVLREGIR
jgi:Holliday junction resolvase